MAKAKRKFQIGDLCTTDHPRWMNEFAPCNTYSIYEVVGYKDRLYELRRTDLSLEKYNKIAWRKLTGEEVYKYDGHRLHHIPEEIYAEHKRSQLVSMENLEEYEGLFV
jgi:hypothetical protein